MHSYKSIQKELRRFVVSNCCFGQEETELADTDSFMARGLMDSTGILALVSFIEKQYGITIEPQELVPDNLDSLVALTNFVTKKLGPPVVSAHRRLAEA